MRYCLNVPEDWYSALERNLLNLNITARKQKSYSQAHLINVLTNIPLKQVLHKPNLSGWSSKCALELSEYHIDFSPWKIIQGQAFADFLVECTLVEDPDDTKS